MIEVAFLPEMGREYASRRVIVVDTLRASTTIIRALEAGATQVVPAASIREAHARAGEYPRGNVLLAGERRGTRISGFDLGNSPVEFSPRHVHGKTIIMATSNGTRAIQHCADARSVTIGTILNARSVAERFYEASARSDSAHTEYPIIVCAGTDGQISQDDLIGAGSIVEQLLEIEPGAEVDDAGLTAHDLFLAHRENLENALARTAHGRRLLKLGFQGDISIAANLNGSTIVPELNSRGEIRGDSGATPERNRQTADTGT